MSDDIVLPADIPAQIATPSSSDDDALLTLKAFRQQTERAWLLKKLQQFDGNISQMAKALEIDRSYLHKKLTQYEIKREQEFN